MLSSYVHQPAVLLLLPVRELYSQSQSKEKTLGTGKFPANFFFFSTAFYTPVGLNCPELCSSHVFQLCQATEGSLGAQPSTLISKPKTIGSKKNIRAKAINQPYS